MTPYGGEGIWAGPTGNKRPLPFSCSEVRAIPPARLVLLSLKSDWLFGCREAKAALVAGVSLEEKPAD